MSKVGIVQTVRFIAALMLLCCLIISGLLLAQNIGTLIQIIMPLAAQEVRLFVMVFRGDSCRKSGIHLEAVCEIIIVL
ncbi:MAG TPA: hypothetical protein VMW16_12120 [Sedimentisphaerales bacterium]|nr:hypothetical protein [Sedimentisphaerales bacterium]